MQTTGQIAALRSGAEQPQEESRERSNQDENGEAADALRTTALGAVSTAFARQLVVCQTLGSASSQLQSGQTTHGRLRAWLKAGYLEQDMFHSTVEGPQAGIVSPTAANMALDGLLEQLQPRFKGRNKVNLARYADDFVATGASRTVLEDEVSPLVAQFPTERGLVLAEERTRVVHIDRCFDFIGVNVRKYNGKLLIKPAASSIAAVKEKVRAIRKAGASHAQTDLIRHLNPVIRGWAYYYRLSSARECSTASTMRSGKRYGNGHDGGIRYANPSG